MVTLRPSRALESLTPERRRAVAAWLFDVTAYAMVVNVVLYRPFNLIGVEELVLVTLVLSWLALTFTGADWFSTTDVRAQQED